MRFFVLLIGLLLGGLSLPAQNYYFSAPKIFGNKVLSGYWLYEQPTSAPSSASSSLVCFSTKGEIIWKRSMREMGVVGRSFSFAPLQNRILISWGGIENTGNPANLYFAVLDSNGRKSGQDFFITPERDIPGAQNLGHWYMGNAIEMPNGGLLLTLVTTDNGDNPIEDAYTVTVDANRRVVAHSTSVATVRNPLGNEVYIVDSLSFNATTRRFAFRAGPNGMIGPLVNEPATLPAARHYLAPVCTACLPELANEEIPPITTPSQPNPTPGQARPGVGMFDTLIQPNTEAFDLDGNPVTLPLLADLNYFSGTQVFCTGPGQFVLATLATPPISVSNPNFTAIVLSGIRAGQFVWRTVIYVPFGGVYEQLNAYTGTNGSLRLGFSSPLRYASIALDVPNYLALDIAADGTLASPPVWRKGDGATYGSLHPLPNGGWCISQQGRALEFYGPSGPVLRRVNGVTQ